MSHHPLSDIRLVTCPECEGLGEWDEGPLPARSHDQEPEYRRVICPDCEGTGQIEHEVDPIDMADLDEPAEGADAQEEAA